VDAGVIGGTRHEAAKCIDFPDEVALADTTDGGIAAHLTERLDVVSQQQGAGTQACRGQRGLGSGMPAADNDYIKGPVHYGHCFANGNNAREFYAASENPGNAVRLASGVATTPLSTGKMIKYEYIVVDYARWYNMKGIA
jgi:hypothetical protein